MFNQSAYKQQQQQQQRQNKNKKRLNFVAARNCVSVGAVCIEYKPEKGEWRRKKKKKRKYIGSGCGKERKKTAEKKRQGEKREEQQKLYNLHYLFSYWEMVSKNSKKTL